MQNKLILGQSALVSVRSGQRRNVFAHFSLHQMLFILSDTHARIARTLPAVVESNMLTHDRSFTVAIHYCDKGTVCQVCQRCWRRAVTWCRPYFVKDTSAEKRYNNRSTEYLQNVLLIRRTWPIIAMPVLYASYFTKYSTVVVHNAKKPSLGKRLKLNGACDKIKCRHSAKWRFCVPFEP